MSEETTESTTAEVVATAETAGSPEVAPVSPPAESQETDWVAEARKWEKRAKDSAAKLKDAEPKLSKYDELVAANQTDLERAQEAAQKATSTITAMRERVATADIRAALTGIVPDPAAVIEDLNISRFIGDDGEVNTEAVTALRAKYAALAPEGKRLPAPNPAQGSSGGGAPDAEALIAQAQASGDWKTVIALQNQKLTTPQRG